MTSSKPTLFLVGTGFIGGTLLTSLLKEGKHEISALSRSEDKANKLKELGVRPVMGSLDDEILVEESAKADVSILLAVVSHISQSRDGFRSLIRGKLTLNRDRDRLSFMLLLPTINHLSNQSSKVSLNDPKINLPQSTFTLPAVHSLSLSSFDD